MTNQFGISSRGRFAERFQLRNPNHQRFSAFGHMGNGGTWDE
jgi:hypothetical protein